MEQWEGQEINHLAQGLLHKTKLSEEKKIVLGSESHCSSEEREEWATVVSKAS